MRYYFAPLEGVTDSVYRRLHHAYFGGVDRYYMPFFSPTMHRTLTGREDRELPPASSVPFAAVPQVLTKSAEDFIWAAQVCRDRGYEEVNLNIGCLTACTAQRLMDHHLTVGKSQTLALGTGRKQKCAHACRHAHADR